MEINKYKKSCRMPEETWCIEANIKSLGAKVEGKSDETKGD